MTRRDGFELVVLAAIWGSSFLFMRIAAPEFGPIALIEMRIVIAAVFLGTIAVWQGGLPTLRAKAGTLTVLGVLNSALPFTLFAYAVLSVTAGFAAVLNATAPLFGALVGFVWLRERLAPSKLFGLALGFVGVVMLVAHKLAIPGDRLATLAGLAAGLCYGISGHFTKKTLSGVSPLVIAAGSQIAAAVVLAPLAALYWPSAMPSLTSWLCALALGIGCTGVAYVLYFRLLKSLGPARAITVTYLIPVFGILWGHLFLHESITLATVLGGVVVLAGTTLVTRGASKAAVNPQSALTPPNAKSAT